MRSTATLGEILRLAYGAQPADAVHRRHRALSRVAAQLECGDLAKASLEAVMGGFPDVAPPALAKLATFAILEKGGTAWQNEPRIPAGQTGGGQWTTGGGGTTSATSDNGNANVRVRTGQAGTGAGRPSLLDDGVYRPAEDRPVLTATDSPDDADEGFRHGIGGNEPPYDFMELSDLFPTLKDHPEIAFPLAPLDSFLGVSGLADEANLAASTAEFYKLCRQIQAVDPTWRYDEVEPLASLNWQGRANVIKDLLMERARIYYTVRGNIGPLQVETLRFLEGAVDKAYQEAVDQYNAGRLPVRLSRGEAIGNFVDLRVRQRLKQYYSSFRIPFGPKQQITINNQDVSTASQSYRIPDARAGRVSFDWSLVFKTLSSPQVKGFFSADSEPVAVVIVRPRQLERGGAYWIPRPQD